jgi:hypothetical protein
MRSPRSVLAGFVLVGACLSASAAQAAPACGLGPPPDSPGFAEARARERAEVARNGYLRVCDANLARYDVSGQLRPLAAATQGLAFRPVALVGTPFAGFTTVGAMPESVGATASRLYRVFRMGDGHLLTLFEHDMSADGSSMQRAPADEPERINGLPARLVVLQGESGKAVSVLSWLEGRRYYELWLDANVALTHARPQLLALAASLPKSVPAKAGPAPAPQGVPATVTFTAGQARATQRQEGR